MKIWIDPPANLPLSEWLRGWWMAARQTPGAQVEATPLRERAAKMVLAVGAHTGSLQDPQWVQRMLATIAINAAGFGCATGSRLTAHRLRAAACRRIAATTLGSWPGEPPQLFRDCWVLEGKHPERGEALVHWTYEGCTMPPCTGIAGYPAPTPALPTQILLILRVAAGCIALPWVPRWEERERGTIGEQWSPIEEGVSAEDYARLRGAARVVARAALEFALRAAILLEAEGSPLQVRHEEDGSARRAGPVQGAARTTPTDGWHIRHVTLGGTEPLATTPLRERDAGPSVPQARDGLQSTPTFIRGHLRRQPCGPRNEQRKWIYVEGYEAPRWSKDGAVQVRVHDADE